MYVLDFYGPADVYDRVRDAIEGDLAAVYRAPADLARARRIVVEQRQPEVELWVEVSSEEQVVRFGPEIARRLTDSVRAACDLDVWVLFRIVPLSHAFLNGAARARARLGPD
jgi:hypothetical protein